MIIPFGHLCILEFCGSQRYTKTGRKWLNGGGHGPGGCGPASIICATVPPNRYYGLHPVSGTRPSGVAQFAGVPHHSRNYGPVIEETVASLGCRLHAAHPCGDHHIVIGEVESVEASPSRKKRGSQVEKPDSGESGFSIAATPTG
ncbi:MAG: flavin reductase family protein [Gemmataceae bacterium]